MGKKVTEDAEFARKLKERHPLRKFAGQLGTVGEGNSCLSAAKQARALTGLFSCRG